MGRGVAYSRIGKYQKAILDLSKAIEINPEFASAYKYRSICYERKGNKRRAKEDYDKACELDELVCNGLLNLY